MMKITGFMSDALAADYKMMQDEKRESLLAEVLPTLPQRIELGYVDQGDQLMDEQIANLFRGDEIGGHFDEWEDETRWFSLDGYLNDVQYGCGIDSDEMDLIRDDLIAVLYDRDEGNLLGDLLRGTPDKWMRYWIDERNLDTDELIDRVYIGVNGVGEILTALGLLDTDQHTPELEEQIAGILANAGNDVAIYVLWYGEVDDLIEAAAHDYEGGPKQTITWENPYLLLFNPFMGSGWADEITCKITVPFDHTNLRLDTRDGGSGYSFTDETCGGWIEPRDHSTNMTITREDAS